MERTRVPRLERLHLSQTLNGITQLRNSVFESFLAASRNCQEATNPAEGNLNLKFKI